MELGRPGKCSAWTGTASGDPSHSIYFRDPYGNLLEIMSTTL